MRHLYAYFCCLLIDVAMYAKNKATNSSSNIEATGATLRASADSHTPPEGIGRETKYYWQHSDREWDCACACVCVCVSVGVLSSSNQ